MSYFNFSRRNKNKQTEQFQPTLFEQREADASAQEENEPLEEGVPMTTKLKIFAALFVVGFAGYIAFWVQSPSEIQADVLSDANGAQLSEQIGETQQISMVDFSFDPPTLPIQKGTTVVWTNKDSVPHNVTADTFSSGTLSPGQTFSYTFNQNGIFDYHCSFHPQMKASITVDDDQNQPQASGNAESQPVGDSVEPNLDETATTSDSPSIPPLTALTPEDQNIITESQSSTVAPTPLIDGSELTEDSTLMASTDSLQTNPESPEGLHGAAVEPLSVSAKKIINATKVEEAEITNAGPEHYLYFGIFGVILFLNRKKLLKVRNDNA